MGFLNLQVSVPAECVARLHTPEFAKRMSSVATAGYELTTPQAIAFFINYALDALVEDITVTEDEVAALEARREAAGARFRAHHAAKRSAQASASE